VPLGNLLRLALLILYAYAREITWCAILALLVNPLANNDILALQRCPALLRHPTRRASRPPVLPVNFRKFVHQLSPTRWSF
jgi:hypothetical protein